MAGSRASGIVSFEGMCIKMHNFFLHKKSEIRDERTNSLVDADPGTVAAMIMNWLHTNPIAASIVKATIDTLETDPTADVLGRLFLGGND